MAELPLVLVIVPAVSLKIPEFDPVIRPRLKILRLTPLEIVPLLYIPSVESSTPIFPIVPKFVIALFEVPVIVAPAAFWIPAVPP